MLDTKLNYGVAEIREDIEEMLENLPEIETELNEILQAKRNFDKKYNVDVANVITNTSKDVVMYRFNNLLENMCTFNGYIVSNYYYLAVYSFHDYNFKRTLDKIEREENNYFSNLKFCDKNNTITTAYSVFNSARYDVYVLNTVIANVLNLINYINGKFENRVYWGEIENINEDIKRVLDFYCNETEFKVTIDIFNYTLKFYRNGRLDITFKDKEEYQNTKNYVLNRLENVEKKAV